jgi:hypothetical protein
VRPTICKAQSFPACDDIPAVAATDSQDYPAIGWRSLRLSGLRRSSTRAARVGTAQSPSHGGAARRGHPRQLIALFPVVRRPAVSDTLARPVRQLQQTVNHPRSRRFPRGDRPPARTCRPSWPA